MPQWLEDRQAELLPVEYFHVVFTLPERARRARLPEQGGGLRPAVPRRRRDLAHDRRRSEAPRRRDRLPGRAAHLGPEPAASPARPLRRARRRAVARWRSAGSPAGPASSCRCGCCRGCSGGSSSAAAAGASIDGELQFFHDLGALQRPRGLRALARRRRQQAEWVVYAKPPFGGPEQVLEYLGRYTHRVAISNRRLSGFEDGQVPSAGRTTGTTRAQGHDARRATSSCAASCCTCCRRLRAHPPLRPAGQPPPRRRSWRSAGNCWRAPAPQPVGPRCGLSRPLPAPDGPIAARLPAVRPRQMVCVETFLPGAQPRGPPAHRMRAGLKNRAPRTAREVVGICRVRSNARFNAVA